VNAEWKRCNYSKKHDTDFVDYIDEQIRIACHQYRTLKKDPLSQKRFFKKASVSEAEVVQEVLSLIKWTEDDGKGDGCAEPQEDEAGMVPALLQDEQEELSKWPVKN
ncbi:Uncharacterized protein SCF082_LOCUS42764, partial [Durusdinium trenchii]